MHIQVLIYYTNLLCWFTIVKETLAPSSCLSLAMVKAYETNCVYSIMCTQQLTCTIGT